VTSENSTDAEVELEITVSDIDRSEWKRLDQYLTKALPQFSRSTIKRLFEDEQISSEQVSLSLNKMPPTGTVINIEVPPPIPTDLKPENIPLEILFEDPHLIIINKPAGLVVHPAPGHYTGTLVNAILHHCPDLKGVGGERRPGIVHRLDMGTSGVMVIAKDQKTHEGLVGLFSLHDIDRKYEALIWGAPKNLAGTIQSTLGRHPTNRFKMAANVKLGKRAVTHYKVLKQFEHTTHLELKLETGRTHQIRVHCAQILQHAILCDPLYGNGDSGLKKLNAVIAAKLKEYPYQLLHAKELGFIHPVTGEKLFFSAPPPAIFMDSLALQ
jgi:23S rRNA pseudouridine1911/1915/1917 synthase